MNVLQEIRVGFANVREGFMLPIQASQADCEAWVFREDCYYGVAVPLATNLRLLEFFAGAQLETVERSVDGHPRALLRLGSSSEALRNEFAVVCAQFVAPGIDGQERDALTSDPLSWWNRWRQLLGNANRDRQAHSTLGELLVLERLISQGICVSWTGPLRGSVDIETCGASYEVKSTLSRYGSVVHIAGQFQLKRSKEIPLRVVHLRFEPSAAGDSIDAAVFRLAECGLAIEELETSLACTGFHAGGAARAEKYKLLESTVYEVNADFPSITPSSFLNGVIPAGVVSIEYDVDLSALKGARF